MFLSFLFPLSFVGRPIARSFFLFFTLLRPLTPFRNYSAVQTFLFTQKLTTIIGALGFWVLLTWFDPTTSTASSGLSMFQGYSLFALMILVSGVLKLSALGWSISIERDWIVALCYSNSDVLTRKSPRPSPPPFFHAL
jgi:hypothetical protein